MSSDVNMCDCGSLIYDWLFLSLFRSIRRWWRWHQSRRLHSHPHSAAQWTQNSDNCAGNFFRVRLEEDSESGKEGETWDDHVQFVCPALDWSLYNSFLRLVYFALCRVFADLSEQQCSICYICIKSRILWQWAPCGLRGCRNWPAPFPGQMSYKATKPGLALSVVYLSMFYCIFVY